MKVLLLIGKDRHNYRILRGLLISNPNIELFTSDISDTYESPDLNNATFSIWNRCRTDYKGKHFELVMVDPSYPIDRRGSFTFDRLGFFDCEDSPDHDYDGEAYNLFKDDATFYAKMDYPLETREDGLKYIAFPIDTYLSLNSVANVDLPEFTHQNATPSFLGSPSYLGKPQTRIEKPQMAGDIYFANDLPDGDFWYNQRYQWLQSLQDNNIPYEGGVVFLAEAGGISLKYQSEHFGNVAKFKKDYIDRNSFFNMAIRSRIGLNPAGNARNSWRMYDLMAIGSIILTTDTEAVDSGMKSLYSPKEFIVVKDTDDLGSVLRGIQPAYKELAKASKENRKVLADLTPEKVWNDFLAQI
tara:strand:+ start:23384 stop:24451 length:1068 start_codon:yes stop_codon:yes gene_type:complete